MKWMAGVLSVAVLFTGASFSGEDAPKPPEEGRRRPDRGGGRDAGGRDAGAAAGAWIGGGGFGGGFGGQGGAQGRGVGAMVSRMLGIEVDDTKSVKVDALPLGVEKRFVLSVPVGGVDTPAGTGTAWKVEAVFKLTDEQQKSVDTLRDEYKAEQKKLEQEILDQQKALAEKVKELRLKFEKRANDVLTGDDKAAKEKMDALTRETAEKNAKIVADILPLYQDNNDFMQQMAMVRSIREKTSPLVKEAEEKLVGLVPEANRNNIAEAIKSQSAIRERMSGWMDNMGRRGGPPGAGGRGEGGAGGKGEPVQPPRPPEPGNF